MSAEHRPAARRTALRSGLSGLLVGSIVWIGLTASGVLAPASPAHAADSSAVTVTAAQQDQHLSSAPLPDLSVTVSQTQRLTAQGIRISWTGGKKSIAAGPGNGGENFLQIFMCWGDDPEDADRPDRTTCEYGGASSPGATRDGYRAYPLSDIPAADQPYSAPSAISFLPPFTSIPFIARDGTRVDGIVTDAATGAKSIDTSVDVNNNQFFTNYSTNEVPWVGSGDNGKGAVSFEVQTAAQSSGLGCGTAITRNGQTTGAGCWLVILPRGTSDNGSINITQSGLFADSWQHALAVRLGFEPIGARCEQGAAERQLAGSELATLAVNAWQPVVCKGAGASIYSLLTMPESDAVAAAATSQGAPLALTSFPWQTDGADPLRYAPIALTGLAVSIAIDRQPDPFKNLPASYVDAARTPFTSMNLTPRLLAKLLSYSYRFALPPGADTGYLTGTAVYNITKDPDFLAVNDKEWAAQDIAGAAVSDIMIPQGRSDAARAVWAYIASDADARDFLASKPDPWGMVVNPWYSTNASKNPSGTAFSLDRDDFPKADPVEADPPNVGPVNIVTWRPFSSDLGTNAYLTLRGDGQLLGTWDQYAIPPKYNKGARLLPGNQAVIGLTTTSSASRYQVVTASLENPAGAFVAPTTSAMEAAAAAMTAVDKTSVLGFDAASTTAKGATTAYPLTLPVYAAANPAETDASLRAAYAAFITYATSTGGQTPGIDIGTLPDGYAPIPTGWVTAAKTAAAAIAVGTQPTAASDSGSGSSSDSGSGSYGGSSDAVGASEGAQPSATGTASPTLSSSVTPADPEAPASPALGYALLAGLASAVISHVASRRRAIRSWVRR